MEENAAEFDSENATLSPKFKMRVEINKILGYAKLDRNDLLESCQRVSFDENLDNGEIKLMEIDESLAEKIRDGERLVIRGDAHETVVLCTTNRTYELKEAETSNSLLLSPDLLYPDQMEKHSDDISQRNICSVLHTYYELKPCRPKLKKLRTLLEQNPYCGRIEEANNTERKYTYADLMETIQASEREILEAITKLQAFDMNGYVRVLDFELLTKVITSIEGLMYEESWSVDCLPADACCGALDELYDRRTVLHVLKSYGDCLDPDADSLIHDFVMSSDTVCYKLNESRIARFYATMLLRDTGKFNLRDFTETWQQSVPDGMIADISYLQGLAIVDRGSKPEVIWYFPVENLPEDINDRFTALFKTKEKWNLEEIAPYVEEFSSAKVTVNALLTKHCRTSMLNGVRVYSSRRPV